MAMKRSTGKKKGMGMKMPRPKAGSGMKMSRPKGMECEICGGATTKGKCMACGKPQGMCEC